MSLSSGQTQKAEYLYNDFFRRYGQPHPTGINTLEKFNFAQEVGFENFLLMVRAQKDGHPFTKLSVYQKQVNEPAVASASTAPSQESLGAFDSALNG